MPHLTPSDAVAAVDDLEVVRLCEEVGQALHAAGAPAHRVEAGCDAVREAFGREGAAVATPTALWLQVGDRTRIARLPAGDIHLGRLVAVLRQVQRMQERPTTPAMARKALARILEPTSPWPLAVERIAFIATSALAAVLLGGAAQDVALSIVGGSLALVFLGRVGALSAWTPLRDALLATLLGMLGAVGVLIGANPSVVALASAILVVPGLSLTTALSELGAGHWTAGGSRLLGALLCLAQLAAGLAIGWWAVGDLPTLMAPVPVPATVVHLTPLLAPAGFAILLRARPQDLPSVWLTAILGWSVASTLPGVAGAAAGGLTVALVAGTLGRIVRMPDLALIVPGILLLVPGTVGVHGVEQLLSRALLEGAGTALAALETAGAIAGSVFAGQAFVRSAEALYDERVSAAASAPAESPPAR